MSIIQEREIIKRIPVYVRKGRNAGKQTGMIYFERNKEPYYFIRKNWMEHQLYQAPKHRNTLSISKHILEELEKYDVKNVIFMITGMEKGSFYYIVPLKKFWEGEKTDYDDTQYRIRVNNLTRYYPSQEGISKYIQNA